jgi:hypothetical protein
MKEMIFRKLAFFNSVAEEERMQAGRQKDGGGFCKY